MFHPAVYVHRSRKIVALAHVDDFLCLGSDKDLHWLYEGFATKCIISHKLLSGDYRDLQEAKFLNRTTRVTPTSVQLEGDRKHAKILIEEWGMGHSNPVETPLTSELVNNSENRPYMNDFEANRYRRAVASINYMSQDRYDLFRE